MISTSNVSLGYGAKKLFDEVNIKFTPGNCYGLIGANGAGKSTFLKILSGEVSPNTGEIILDKNKRLSVLKQDHFAYDEHPVLKTVIMGNQKLFEIMKKREEIYSKADFNEEDGMKAAHLEEAFADMNGYEAESEAGILLSGLGINTDLHNTLMRELSGGEKVKVLLAQALFGQPDVILLDEPTNHLDISAIKWLEDFLFDFENTVVVVSHDRHFLNKVCTHIADIDFGKITTYTGNYDFWKRSSELAVKLRADQKKKAEDKAEELKTFIARFSANAAKSKQATSRKKQLENLNLNELPVSTRRSPFVQFNSEREAGKDILRVENLSKSIDGVELIKNLSFTVNKNDKIAIISDSDQAKSCLFQLLAGEIQADSGEIHWGVTTSHSYFPTDNSAYFDKEALSLIDWLRQYSNDQDESFIRGFLGKMLFSKTEAEKKTNVLSGGEKVRCMLAKMMLSGANVLLFDEPTAHLDLESITAVNDGVSAFNGTVIFTSHDHEFVQTVANRIIEINKTLVNDRLCSYDEYLAL